PAAWVIRHNRTRQVTTPVSDEADSEIPLASRIVAPLRGREGVAGLLTVSRSADPGPFSPEEFELIQLFAGQLSIALQNAEPHRAAAADVALHAPAPPDPSNWSVI